VRSASFGWAGKYRVTEAGVGSLTFDGGLLTPLSLVCSVIVWLAAVAVVAGRRIGLSWRRVRTGRRRPRGRRGDPAGGPDGPDGSSGGSSTSDPITSGIPSEAGTAT
jgi:hypothetical protein